MNPSLLMPFGSCESMEFLFNITLLAVELCFWNKPRLGDTTMEHDISGANLITVSLTRLQDVTQGNFKLKAYAHWPITLLPAFSQIRFSWPKKEQKVKQDSNRNGVSGLRGLLATCVASTICIRGGCWGFSLIWMLTLELLCSNVTRSWLLSCLMNVEENIFAWNQTGLFNWLFNDTGILERSRHSLQRYLLCRCEVPGDIGE